MFEKHYKVAIRMNRVMYYPCIGFSVLALTNEEASFTVFPFKLVKLSLECVFCCKSYKTSDTKHNLAIVF